MLSSTAQPDPASPPHKNRVYVWDGVLMYVSRNHLNGMHAHYPALLQIGLGAQFALTLPQQPRQYHSIVVMAPNVSHSTDSEDQPYLVVLIDPDHALYCYLHPLLDGKPLCAMPADALAAFQLRFGQLLAGQLQAHDAMLLLTDILYTLCGPPLPQLPWDNRILQACQYMTQLVPQHTPTAAQVAAHVGLSESRLMHLFSAQLGISMRQYMLWLRLRYAIKLWMAGYSLLDMALASGFADQAHFNRTLRRMTDFAPSVLKASTVFMGEAESEI